MRKVYFFIIAFALVFNAFFIESAVAEDGSAHIPATLAEPMTLQFAIEEPRIRVGLLKPQSFVQFRSEEADYDIYDGETKLGVLPMDRLGVLKYEDGKYRFTGAGMEFVSDKYFRLSPVDNPHAVFILPNIERRVKWAKSVNFNAYRGALEYRLTQDGKTMYLINDVLMEDYVAGVAETSSVAPMEYMKALLTAARTYAYYVREHTTKHDKRNFDVVATTGDQLYLGVEHERFAPRVAEAARATRGYYVTFEDAVVITPYFARSNGKTRPWGDVWRGTKPWLVSVAAIYDTGRSRYGHGVGMSQNDAAARAKKEGADWQTLVRYYYTGVEVEQLYQ